MTETKNTDMATARKLTRIAQNLQALVGMMALVNISDNEITDIENLSDGLVELDK